MFFPTPYLGRPSSKKNPMPSSETTCYFNAGPGEVKSQDPGKMVIHTSVFRSMLPPSSRAGRPSKITSKPLRGRQRMVLKGMIKL